MKFNKSFKTSSKFSEKEIALIEKLLGVTLPTELKFFYQVYGGIKLEEPVKSAYYITLDEKKGITPLLAFFDYQELILEIDYFKEDAGVEDIAPLNEFVPIAYAHGQFRILMELNNEQAIYLLDVECHKIARLATNIEELINYKIKPNSELEF